MALRMREIFLKPVDRPIDGVIKADDEASLRIELDEYVITDEISKRLSVFLDAYNNYATANGVWISGFFGSGKSHLLKMLALLLENRTVDGIPAFDYFKDKKELTEDPMLRGALQKATAIPSQSILFNIDQKADVITTNQTDALLSVFQKVFDEACGYYGKQAYIAQFERDLDGRGILSSFKGAYTEISGKDWERGREQSLLEGPNIAKAYARATGASESDAAGILSKYRTDHKVSIEDFANTVKAWLDAKGPKFRLNFFVDEVGQYIADDVRLMTNLQTIAESLNTKCKGQAWIIVTAQQDMNSVIGDMNARQANDFSKIQARFATRMPLNSADVAEVIQRRLLAKTEEGEAVLKNLYAVEENNLRTLFDFADGSAKLKNYQDGEHFIQSYPFPPYQYALFQRAIQSMSEHNVFEGRHSSVGERSMLGVFQEVAKKLADYPVGGLATFDLMFEGIRSALKSSAQQSIQLAEKSIDGIDPFAMRVLKALFLVKYVKEFKPTVRNIGILLLSEFEADQVAQKRKIEEALNLLERQTLIQRNGEVYEFLTNEEVDVQNEIKGLEVDPSEITKDLETLIFEDTIKQKKIKHLATNHEYAFSRMLDDRLLGREYELAINIITPVDGGSTTPEAVRMRSMTREELAIVLAPDARFVKDLTLYRKKDKFLRQATTAAPQEGRSRIIGEIREQMSRNRADLKNHLHRLMADAKFFVRGEDVEIGGEDPQERVLKAFQVLVDKVYVNLPMLRGESYSESEIGKFLKQSPTLFGAEGTGLTEAQQEILNHANAQAKLGVRVTVKSLLEKFEAKPYGWPTAAVLCVTASLLGLNKLEARSDSSLLEGADLEKALRNSNLLGNIVVTPQVEFQPSQVKRLRDFYKDFFDTPIEGNDAKALGAETASAFTKLRDEVSGLLGQEHRFPFLAALRGLSDLLNSVTGKPATWYVTDLPSYEDKLLDAKEDLLDPIKTFMGGQQKSIYEEVSKFLAAQAENFVHVGHSEAEDLRKTLADPNCYKGSTVQNLKTRYNDLKTALDLKIIEERKAVEAVIADTKTKIEALPELAGLGYDQRSTILSRIEKAGSGLTSVTLIAVLRNKANEITSNLYPHLVQEILHMARPAPAPQPVGGLGEAPAAAPKPPQVVKQQDIKPSFAQSVLSQDSDVNAYVEALRIAMLAEIHAGKKIIV